VDPNLPLYGKMKKPLTDLKKLKCITKTDRVIVIGCTNKIEALGMRDAKKLFEMFIYFPLPNYGTRLMLLQHMIEEKSKRHKNVTIPLNFELSALAYIADNHSAGNFKIIFDRVLTDIRIMRIADEPLKISEFLGPLLN